MCVIEILKQTKNEIIAEITSNRISKGKHTIFTIRVWNKIDFKKYIAIKSYIFKTIKIYKFKK